MFARHRWLLSIGLACSLESATPAEPAHEDNTPHHEGRDDPLPPGALARFGSTRFRALGADHCLAVSPDGKVLAAGGESSVRLWDRATGRELGSVKLKDDHALVIVFSPDSKQFAALADKRPYGGRARFEANPDFSVIVGEVGGGKLRVLGRGKYDHETAAFTPDGKHLLTWGRGRSEEAAAILWDVASGKQVRRFPAAICYALSPDGKLLAGGTGGERSGSVHLWDVSSGAETRQWEGHRCPVHALAFSPDGRTLLSGSMAHPSSFDPDDPLRDRDNSVRLWDLRTGKERRPPLRHAHAIERLLFGPDGKTFVSLDERGRLFLWDAATGKLRECFSSVGFRGPAVLLYSPDGKYLFYEGRFPNHDNPLALYQWDIAAGREKRLLTVGLETPAAVCSPDGKTLFWLGDTIRAWDIAKGQEQRSAEGADDYVLTADFTPDGKSLLVLRGDHSLRSWDITRRAYVPSFAARDVEFYRFSPDRRSLRTVGSDESLSERDLTSGRILRRYGGPPDSKRTWAPDGRIFATLGEYGRIHLWDALRGEETRRLEGHRGRVYSVTFSADGRWLFSTGEDATLQWWEVRTGRRIERFQDEATDHVSYALSQDGRLLAWASGERIHLWDLSARKEQRVFRGHAFGTNWVELEREGRVLVSTGRDDSTIRCWDTRTGQEFRAIPTGNRNPLFPLTRLFTLADGRILAYGVKSRDTGFVLLHPSTGIEICRTPKEVALEPSPDGKIVAVPGDKLRFHEVISGGVIAEAPPAHCAEVRWMRFSPDGKLLLTAGQDGVHLLWDWRRLTGLTREGAAEVGDRERETAWQDLASPDARKAYRAIVTLTDSGDKAVALLRERLRPAAVADHQRWRRWIAGLDASDFAVREKAAQALMRLGVEAELFLRRATAEKVSLETRRRLEQIVASEAMKRPSGDSLRKIRATQALEGIGTPAARALLDAWSRGDADAWLTQESRSALRCLERGAADRRVP